MFNLRQVEIFCALMRCRTTTAAAYELAISQPAVSNAIKHMEAQIGFRLFERVANRLVPTVEAKSLYRDAEHLHALARAIARKSSELRHTKRGHIRVVSTNALGHGVVPEAIARFLHSRPDVHVYYDVLRMEGVVESIETGFADIGIAIAADHRPTMEVVPFLDGQMVCAMPSSHRLTARSMVSIGDLREERIVGMERGSRLGALVAQAFDSSSLPYQPIIEVRACATACDLVGKNLGVAVVDQFSAAAHGPGIVVKPFAPTIPISAVFLHLKEHPISKLARRFVEELKQMSGDDKSGIQRRASLAG